MIVLLFIIIFVFIRKDKEIQEFERIYHLKLPESTVSEKLYDDYGGIPYEGMWLYRYVFTIHGKRQFISHITTHDKWNTLPLSNTMNILMYGGTVGNRNYSFRFAEKVGLPKVTDGYWKVISDNSVETADLKDLENIRSFDFSLAIYDIDNGVLYMFKINT